ncbi:hypothetical protein SAMN05216249_11566 [Acetitomaculum ruminis DSM 5522]|uniref:Flagellar Assembly Protein A N-terminal region domain-containing protein n=1 Tax=Acetitomaculum ruminis DSM 5522 TaxID=1120918 RepID=A0A1I0ZI03_9FIRM|nr:FapA family protein [Acetitomaculum ruminis]SFB25409.1 hypothetical protein SAMN05216249_11566 [Acetitomaculum ruminis DSM 5522]
MKNGFFILENKDDGLFMTIRPAVEGGKQVKVEDVYKYLDNGNVTKYSHANVKKAVEELSVTDTAVTFQLTPKPLDIDIDEQAYVSIATDRMSATVVFYPPTPNGKKMTTQGLIKDILNYKIKFGIDEEFLAGLCIEHEYFTDYVFARGIPLVEGKPAKITYHFNTKPTKKPTINPDGTVDYRKLDNISRVNKGQLIAELQPEVQGSNGKDILGNILKCTVEKHLVLKGDKNCEMTEDGLKMYSKVDGHAKLVSGVVNLSNVYEVKNNVDNSTGDIEYSGNVYIKGNVNSGFSIKAKGDVIVDGVVEGADITCGGQIVLKRGIQGMGSGVIRARGNVVAKFIENARVISGGFIETESIIQSNVSATGDINVGGKKGFITGGTVAAGKGVRAKMIGSPMGVHTNIEVGVSPLKRERYKEIKNDILIKTKDIDKLYPILASFWKKIGNGDLISPQQHDYIKKISATVKQLEKIIKQEKEEAEEIEAEITSGQSATVEVSGTVYPDVDINISGAFFKTKAERSYCKFKITDGVVKVENL